MNCPIGYAMSRKLIFLVLKCVYDIGLCLCFGTCEQIFRFTPPSLQGPSESIHVYSAVDMPEEIAVLYKR